MTNAVSNDYLGYLHQLGISYIFAGDQFIDGITLMDKLKALFGIDRIMVAGGGTINWSLLQDNVIDEISIVVAPVVDGSTSAVSTFEHAPFLSDHDPIPVSLIEVKSMDANVLWCRYHVEQK